MTARPLHAVLRALADTGPPDTDADLLRRFVATRDDEAFGALVKRHGRLVWAVCRHLTRSDAEADDAFQATFLVLVRNAAGVKDAAKLSAWLHGVAYKVCGKSRLAAKRRTTREHATAARERNGHAVPDSAWDRALSAVHEEVAGLPDSLRIPFVLCCLEGKGQTEAAEQLGWKLGTLSGRLTRAKDAVLAKLSARGLTLGVLASVGLAVVPSDVSAKAVGLGLSGSVVTGSVLQLSSGVIGMSVHKVKLLAAGVLAACGVAISGGAGWVASAGAQSAAAKPAQAAPADRVKQLEAELQRAKADAEVARVEAELAARKAAEAKKKADVDKSKYEETIARTEKAPKGESTSTKKWEFDFVAASDMPRETFVGMLQEWENKGWEFAGTTPMSEKTVWVFRKPKGKVAHTVESGQYGYYPAEAKPNVGNVFPVLPVETTRPVVDPTPPTPPAAPPAPAAPAAVAPTFATPAPARAKVADTVEEVEAEIKRLQEKLAKLKKSK